MAIIYTNEEINELINESKPLPEDWENLVYTLDYMEITGIKAIFSEYMSEQIRKTC